jgi:hypothetical protein
MAPSLSPSSAVKSASARRATRDGDGASAAGEGAGTSGASVDLTPDVTVTRIWMAEYE